MSFPDFDQNVFIRNPYYPGGIQPANPEMCATQESANHLITLIPDLKPTLVIGPLFPNAAGSAFSASLTTWLSFPSGMSILAGTLCMCWVRDPTPEGLALKKCRAVIAQAEADFVAG